MQGSAPATNAVEYRPSTGFGISAAAIFVVTAAALVWIGATLGPQDRAAMDGFTLLLFTVVPIRAFSWVCGAAFLALGYRSARRALDGEPALVVSDTGILLIGGRAIPWDRVRSAEVSPSGLLVLQFVPARGENGRPAGRRWWLGPLRGGKEENRVALSSLDLGTDPVAVAAEIARRITEV